MTGGQHSETRRQLVHMGMGAFALLLRWLAWWQAIALAAGALAFNLFVLPSVARGLYRPGDRGRGLHGIVFYPIAVLLLLVLFARNLYIAAGAWGVLAAGDGLATIVGRSFGRVRWPWNPEKSVAGSAALALGGGAAGVFLAWWCRDAASTVTTTPLIVAAPIAAAVAAAAVESVPVRLDDNLSVALTAGAVIWLCSLVRADAIRTAWPVVFARLPWAVAVNLLFAFAGFRARTVSLAGAVVGAIIGAIVFAALGWQGWVMLFVTFLAAAIASRLGLRRKMLLGIAEERGGRRGPGNAIANTGIAAIAAALAAASLHPETARWAFVAALTAGGSDTVASEIGKAWGRTTWSIASLRRVAPGTSGAISGEGTAAGLGGAVLLAGCGIALGLVPVGALAPIVIAATISSFLESGLGATLEAPGILNNDMLNLLNTAVAALIAAGWAERLA
jgi:uncharacterized protein (TIGR00297 family)